MQGDLMRNTLGRGFIFIFVLHLSLFASTYKWSSFVNKKEAYTNEAIYLKYICEFSDESELYVLEFNPISSNDTYDLELLSETQRVIDEKRINTYEFVLFVKKAGKFNLELETNVKKTNKDSIENSVLGRDNANYEEFSSTLYKHEKISLDILDANASLVGDFQLSVKKDEAKVKAFEPYHLEVIIKGKGNFSQIDDLHFSIKNTKVFTQMPTRELVLSKDGYGGVWSQKFAFVGENNFTIPSLRLEYFDLVEKRKKELLFEAINVNVVKGYKKEELLDEVEEFHFPFEYLYYVLSFLFGFVVAKIKFKTNKKTSSQEE
jgi:hypothetical protein